MAWRFHFPIRNYDFKRYVSYSTTSIEINIMTTYQWYDMC